MTNFWYIKDFHGARKGRIGASDICKMISNPENPTESLAGYENTAITLYKEKRGEPSPFTYNLSAEMGHYLENKALELFIRRFSGKEIARDFILSKQQYEMLDKSEQTEARVRYNQNELYKHNTQFYNDDMIAHPDCVYIPSEEYIQTDYEIIDEHGKTILPYKKTIEGITVDLSKPFLIEAKSAQLFAAKRRENTIVKGYNFDLTTWHGIPLKHYVQIQFQLALFQIDVAYLALIYDTSKFQIWRVDANNKWQARIIDLVGRMVKHIKNGTMPKELAMNKADIMEIYPKIDKDYVMLTGDKLDLVKDLCLSESHAKQQEANWKAKRKDAQDALAVMLKDYGELRDGSDVLVKWQEKEGSISIGKPKNIPVNKQESFIKWLGKNDLNAYRYFERKGFIKQGKGSRSVSNKFKGE